MKKQTKRTIQLVSGAVATALLARAAYRQNHQLDISSFVYHNEKLPGSFHLICIMHALAFIRKN